MTDRSRLKVLFIGKRAFHCAGGGNGGIEGLEEYFRSALAREWEHEQR